MESPYNLIAKLFAGEYSEEEVQQIDDWRNASTENEQLFIQLQKEWNCSLEPLTVAGISKERMWQNIRSSITRKRKVAHSRVFILRITSIAAMIALIVGFALSLMFMNRESRQLLVQEIVITAPSGQKTQISLPDGSAVWLNSESKIIFPSDFNTEKRNLKLEGEAYFVVAKTSPNVPFTIETGDIIVHVTGTSFNVQAYPNDEEIKVALVEGSVLLLSTDNNRIIGQLIPDELAIISKGTNRLNISSCDALVESVWHKNKLLFDNCPADEVWNKLERWYGVNIQVDNQQPNQAYRFTIKTESFTELLSLIDKITPINYKINGEEVQIRYK